MGSLFRQQYTMPGSKPGERVKRQSAKWYISYKNRAGKWVREPAYPDKQASRAMLVRREREVAHEIEGIYDHLTASLGRKIDEHIDEFVTDLTNRRNSPGYVESVSHRVRTVCKLGGIKKIGEITQSRVGIALGVLATGNDEIRKVSETTLNCYLASIQQFAKWLVDDRRAASNGIAAMKGKVVTKKVRNRRPIPPESFERLIASTAQSQRTKLHMTGEERAVLYLLAGATGYRRMELGSVTPESFRFDNDDPRVEVVAATSKRRKAEMIPLGEDVAAFFREWISTRPADHPIWRLHQNSRTAEMIREDMTAAGVALPPVGLTLDFHCLRQTFITTMALASISPKVAQHLARHSSINLTMNTYAKVSSADERAAVGKLGFGRLTEQLTKSRAKQGVQQKSSEPNGVRKPVQKSAPVKRAKKRPSPKTIKIDRKSAVKKRSNGKRK